jgi:hypothetical protein
MKNVIISLLLLLSSSAVHSQERLKAVLLDDNGAPIPYATVYNSNDRNGVITNTEGRFEIDCRPDDQMVIKCLGYQEYRNTAARLQKDSIITLKEAIYQLNEVTITHNDALYIVQRCYFRIRRNYPKKAVKIAGIFKEYSLGENEYYGFLQCDIDIFFKSMASYSRPVCKTKVNSHTSFRHSGVDSIIRFDHRYYLSQFWLFRHPFLRNLKSYQYHSMGYTVFNGSKLMKVAFQPRHPDGSVKQYSGTMYIDMNTYALVFLQYGMTPNQMDFFTYEGRRQKTIKEETKIMFERHDRYYYPAYVISEIGTLGLASDWKEIESGNKDTVSIESVFNFFTKNVEYKPKNFVEDPFPVDLVSNGNIFDQSKDYKGDFILETEKEKQFIELYEK